jgi:hypothetical protein
VFVRARLRHNAFRVPTPASTREALLERTFALYWRHLGWWLALLAPLAVSAGLIHLVVDRAAAMLPPAEGAPALARALTVMPAVAAAAWLLAGAIGGQALALRAEHAAAGRWPSLGAVLATLAPRFLATLATTVLVVVSAAAIGVVSLGAAAAVAAAPMTLLPRWGVSDGSARSISLLLLLPLIVTGAAPVLWYLARHTIAIAISALEPRAPWAALRAARETTRGRVWAVLGLVIVTQCAGNVLVLLSRMVGSLATLLVAPDRFRPLFGEGPLRSADGAIVQLGATLAASFVMLPLMLLPFAVVTLAWRKPSR